MRLKKCTILKYIYREIREKLKNDVIAMTLKLPVFQPGLAIVQVGGREDSNVYIRMKIKAAADIGINAQHFKFKRTITERELLNEVEFFNFFFFNLM